MPRLNLKARGYYTIPCAGPHIISISLIAVSSSMFCYTTYETSILYWQGIVVVCDDNHSLRRHNWFRFLKTTEVHTPQQSLLLVLYSSIVQYSIEYFASTKVYWFKSNVQYFMMLCHIQNLATYCIMCYMTPDLILPHLIFASVLSCPIQFS